MDKEVSSIPKKYLKSGVNIDDLQSELPDDHCAIYKSDLPLMTEQAILHIDGTPTKDYPIRILQAYRQNCKCRWSESTDGSEPTNPFFKLMNELCDKRAKLLDEAIATLVILENRYIKPT